ncbi:toxin RelE [Methylopila capsulata]|nr:toxin RelE [Methylopila capsulata]
MAWTVLFCDPFMKEFAAFDIAVRDELLATVAVLREFGPNLKRPIADALSGSKHANMKELRFAVDRQVWRVAFAFDPARQAVILCGGVKSGVGQRRFYAALIALADRRFDAHLKAMREKQ